MKITGIGGDCIYDGAGRFRLRDKEDHTVMEERECRWVGMIAGGSGIAPMFQLLQTVAESKGDCTGLSLIYSNRSPYDVVLDEDLTDYEKAGKLFYFPVVQAPDEQWVNAEGRITGRMIESFMPPGGVDESLVLVCGPDKLKADV